jgi:TRAP transporter TAXI family solute receptor
VPVRDDPRSSPPALARTVIALAAALIVACTDGAPGSARYLSIATGGTAGVYYPYGGGLGKILSENLPGIEATAEVTAGSIDNLKLIRDDKADVAFSLADTLADAVEGRGAFEGATVPVAALAVLYTNYMHLVARASSPIQRIADLRNRTVSTGSPGSGTESIAFRALEAAGLDPHRDIRRQGLGVGESAGALKDGKIDAFFWSGGIPTPAVQDLSHTPGMAIRLVPNDDVVPSLQARFGPSLYHRIDVPASTYPGVAKAVPVIGVTNVLVVHRSMDTGLAREITRLLFDRQSELASIHPEARRLSVERAIAGSPAPFHPGAVLYYKERGVWTE